MKDEDLLKCPLLQGLDAMHRAELIGLLNDSSVREKLEECLAVHAASNPGCTSGSGDPQKKASWKPDLEAWRRSPKE